MVYLFFNILITLILLFTQTQFSDFTLIHFTNLKCLTFCVLYSELYCRGDGWMVKLADVICKDFCVLCLYVLCVLEKLSIF